MEFLVERVLDAARAHAFPRAFAMKLTRMQLVAFIRIVHLSSALLEPAMPSSPNDGSSHKKKPYLRIAQFEYTGAVLFQRRIAGRESSPFGIFPLILDWLSHRYKFDYTISMGENVSNIVEGGSLDQPRAVFYILSGARDVITAVVEPLGPPSRLVDFIHPFSYSKLSFMIPMPGETQTNVDAVIKPFHFWVWITLALAAGAVLVVLRCLNLLRITRRSSPAEEKKTFCSNIPMYLLATLLNQGGYLPCTLTSMRMVIGAWCLLTLVLVNSYNSTLISYVTATRRAKPLVNSVEELVQDSNVHPVVDRGQGPESLFLTAHSGLFKALGDKLRAYPHSRCNSTKQCIDAVKSYPPQHVYLNAQQAIQSVLQVEYRNSRECKLVMGVDLQRDFALVWALAKGSPYLEEFKRGTLVLHELGLILSWERRFKPDTRPCLSQNGDYKIVKNTNIRPVRLTLSNLTGAFAVLAIGCLISLLAFLTEKIV
ncbi:ionotropic receptor 93a isoform X1 [Daphnia magna]|uniref:ionotropic receptor 93a isoform X1 n=1 Tax=Daphnia magna TaxID=35525 RepID=UPI001E1BAB41|nr:ionotropic receptor 93a isoform X1 [Daphnia magna]XP_045029519.1 ionotropic receptor 93a isoform X1 [Daphnia magna]